MAALPLSLVGLPLFQYGGDCARSGSDSSAAARAISKLEVMVRRRGLVPMLMCISLHAEAQYGLSRSTRDHS
jgi:hypothetical protein